MTIELNKKERAAVSGGITFSEAIEVTGATLGVLAAGVILAGVLIRLKQDSIINQTTEVV